MVGFARRQTFLQARRARVLDLLVGLLCCVCFVCLAARPSLARAEQPCEDAWVAQAIEETGVAMEIVGCPDNLVIVRLQPRDAPTMDVEIANAPEGGFRRVGPLRVSPIISAIYAELPAGQRRDFEALLTWLEGNYASLGLGLGPPPSELKTHRLESLGSRQSSAVARAPFELRWLLLAPLGLLLMLAARRREGARGWTRPRSRDAGAVFVIACAARSVLGFWGPLHANGMGPDWIQLTTGGAGVSLGNYGPGYPELLLPVVEWARAGLSFAPDYALFTVNVLLSGAAAALVYQLARRAGLAREPALLAGGLMALDPVQVRNAATEGYFTVIILFTLFASLAVQRAGQAWARRDGALARPTLVIALWLAAAGLLAAQAARVHPIAWIPVALTPFAGFLIGGDGDGAPGLFRRVGFVTIAGVAVGGIVLLTSYGEIELVRASVIGAKESGGSVGQFLRPQDLVAAGVFPLICVAALVASRGASSARRMLIVVGLVHLACVMMTRTNYGQSIFWRASYDRLFAPMIALGLASLWPVAREPVVDQRAGDGAGSGEEGAAAAAEAANAESPPVRARVYVAVVGALALMSALYGPSMLTRTTEQLEYRALRQQLSSFPAPCTVVYVGAVGASRNVTLPDLDLTRPQRFQGLAYRIRDKLPNQSIPALHGCLLYARSSLCSSAEGRALCEEVERRLPLAEPMMSLELPARPSHVSFPYDQDRVDIALYLVSTSVGADRPPPAAAQ